MSERSRVDQVRHLAERFKELLNDCVEADVMVVDGWGVTSVELSHLRLAADGAMARLRWNEIAEAWEVTYGWY